MGEDPGECRALEPARETRELPADDADAPVPGRPIATAKGFDDWDRVVAQWLDEQVGRFSTDALAPFAGQD